MFTRVKSWFSEMLALSADPYTEYWNDANEKEPEKEPEKEERLICGEHDCPWCSDVLKRECEERARDKKEATAAMVKYLDDLMGIPTDKCGAGCGCVFDCPVPPAPRKPAPRKAARKSAKKPARKSARKATAKKRSKK